MLERVVRGLCPPASGPRHGVPVRVLAGIPARVQDVLHLMTTQSGADGSLDAGEVPGHQDAEGAVDALLEPDRAERTRGAVEHVAEVVGVREDALEVHPVVAPGVACVAALGERVAGLGRCGASGRAGRGGLWADGDHDGLQEVWVVDGEGEGAEFLGVLGAGDGSLDGLDVVLDLLLALGTEGAESGSCGCWSGEGVAEEGSGHEEEEVLVGVSMSGEDGRRSVGDLPSWFGGCFMRGIDCER